MFCNRAVVAVDYKQGRNVFMQCHTGVKEIHFFSKPERFRRGMAFYEAHLENMRNDDDAMVIDATPGYLPVPMVPLRIAQIYKGQKVNLNG